MARADLEHQQSAADEAACLDDADQAAARADPLAGIGAVSHRIGERAKIERGEGDAPQDAGGHLQRIAAVQPVARGRDYRSQGSQDHHPARADMLADSCDQRVGEQASPAVER
jgi:hypothetical protein